MSSDPIPLTLARLKGYHTGLGLDEDTTQRMEKLMTSLTELRMWLALKIIGKYPVVANVEIGGSEGYAVTAKGGKLWSNKGVVIRPSSNFKGGIIIKP